MYKYYFVLHVVVADMMTLVVYGKLILEDIDIKEVIFQPILETQGILCAPPAH
jgi:hypothetical protein